MRLCVAIAAVLVALTALPAAARAGCTPMKPTLVSEIPSEVAPYKNEDGSWALVFRAGLTNEGAGPLTLVGRRDRASRPMRSRQLIDCAGARTVQPVRGIGGLAYARQPTHQHFHLRDLERYRLVSLADGVSHSAYKRGFCLGDSYDTGIQFKHRPEQPGFDGDIGTACGAGKPGLLRMREGVSVGWGDYYWPLIEGQYVDLNGLRAGDYRLLTELDPFRRLVVGSRARSVGGVDIRLSWDGDTPIVEQGGTCNTLAACNSMLPATADPAGAAALGRASDLGARLSP